MIEEKHLKEISFVFYCDTVKKCSPNRVFNPESYLQIEGNAYDLEIIGLVEQYQKYQKIRGIPCQKLYKGGVNGGDIFNEENQKIIEKELNKDVEKINISFAYHSSKLDPELPEIKKFLTDLINKNNASEINIDILSCYSACTGKDKLPDSKTIEDWQKTIEDILKDPNNKNTRLNKVNITGWNSEIVIKNNSKIFKELINKELEKLKNKTEKEFRNKAEKEFEEEKVGKFSTILRQLEEEELETSGKTGIKKFFIGAKRHFLFSECNYNEESEINGIKTTLTYPFVESTIKSGAFRQIEIDVRELLKIHQKVPEIKNWDFEKKPIDKGPLVKEKSSSNFTDK